MFNPKMMLFKRKRLCDMIRCIGEISERRTREDDICYISSKEAPLNINKKIIQIANGLWLEINVPIVSCDY